MKSAPLIPIKMNYTQEDLMKIKQLVGTTDMDNVRIGIQIAKGLGVSIDELVGLFTMDDIVEYKQTSKRLRHWKLPAYGYRNESVISKEGSYRLYKEIIGIIPILLNED